MDWKIGIYTLFVTLLGVFIGFIFSLIASYHIEQYKGRNIFNALVEDMRYNLRYLLKMMVSIEKFMPDSLGRAIFFKNQVIPKWRITIIEQYLTSLSFICSPSELDALSKYAILWDELNAIHGEIKRHSNPDSDPEVIINYVSEWLCKSNDLINIEIPNKKPAKRPWFLFLLPKSIK